VQYCLPTLSEPFYIWLLPYLTPFTLPLIHIALTGSVYSVVAVALERFMTVCYPFRQCKVRYTADKFLFMYSQSSFFSI
jgi:hypothetical protein